ncbi:RNase adapter RapZ [Thermovibrio sp.]
MKRIIVLTGESGAGKSSALKHLEDLGFYSIDNVPPDLIEEFLKLIKESSEITKAALVVDARNPKFRKEGEKLFKKLRESYPQIEFWLFTAEKGALLKRFKETRRPHPLQKEFQNKSLEELIEKEKELYEPLKELVNKVIDTTGINVHQLKEQVKNLIEVGKPTVQVNFLSFGFKYGVPQSADNIFDVRFLPNPHFVPELKSKTGMDREVIDYIMKFKESKETLERIFSLVKFTLPLYEKEGKSYITYAVGCTGGQHRSVAFAELLSERTAKEFPEYQIYVEHREQKERRKVSG